MPSLVAPSELLRFVPGRVLDSSNGLGWRDVEVHSYRHPSSVVELAGVRDFLIIEYRSNAESVQRRIGNHWKKATCGPSDIALMTRAEPSRWHWTSDVDVRHVYLSERLVSNVAQELMNRDCANVELDDSLNIKDSVVNRCVEALWREVQQHGAGSALYAESIGTQLAVHLLRHYSTVSFREPSRVARLSPTQRRRIAEHVEDRIHDSLTLETLACIVGLGPSNFLRRFRQTFAMSPHVYVAQRRLERAQRLLEAGTLSVKEVATICGFADQSHMTRVFRARLNMTPAVVKRIQSGAKNRGISTKSGASGS